MIGLTDIDDRKVLQRESNGQKSLTVDGTYDDPNADHVQARIVDDGTTDGVVSWTTIDSFLAGGTFSGTLSVPQGGWYNVQVRLCDSGGGVLSTDAGVNKLGVGALVACIGQSNIAQWFTIQAGTPVVSDDLVSKYNQSGWTSAIGGDGAAQFGNDLYAALGVPVGLLDYAEGGTALIEEFADGNEWWLDEAPSTVYDDFLTGLSAATDGNNALEGIVWGQGERDAQHGAIQAVYAAGLVLFFARLRTVCGPVPIVLSMLGRCITIDDATVQAVRSAQAAVAGPTVRRVVTFDLPMADNLHYSAAGYQIHGARCAQALLHGARGPRLLSARMLLNARDRIDVTLKHGAGTDIEPATHIQGFEVQDSVNPGTWTALNGAGSGGSALRSSPTTIRLTLDSDVVGARIRYCYGAELRTGGSIDDLGKDNTGLPIEPCDAFSVALFRSGSMGRGLCRLAGWW